MNDSDLIEGRTSTDDADGASGETISAASTPTRRRASRPAGAGAAGTAAPNTSSDETAAARTSGSLTSKLLPELQQIAAGLGVSGVARLRKSQLIEAIQNARPTGNAGGHTATPAAERPGTPSADGVADRAPAGAATAGGEDDANPTDAPIRELNAPIERGERGDRNGRERNRDRGNRDHNGGRGENRGDRGENRGENRPDNRDNRPDNRDDGDDGDRGGGRSRRGRYRDRRRGRDRATGGGGGQNEAEPVIREDDVLAPVAGILDVTDNYAFLRTRGYLAAPDDVYVSMNLVRRHALRRGDALTGVVKANASESEHQGSRREKYNPLVRLDTVNGLSVEEARKRPEFTKLVPLYPQERLRLETDSNDLVTRVIDIVMPIGKGQRALIVSPPKAGKTTVLQRIANAITQNNPECHLMVVLVDERPEEVTDMQRSVKGEVIASTFDRPATDHTTVAELAIERAKRLVELGHDVVVLLDSITRLGRAYNLAAPASGRILSGGVDSTALYPPKRFLGAARNIENGGSLTILATALVETGSMMDTVIFEEFKGTGNAELKLDRKIADKRVFPAVDIDASGTRKEELLMSAEEMAIVHKLRRVLHALDGQQAIDLLIDKLKQTRTNIEFLMQIAKTTPGE